MIIYDLASSSPLSDAHKICTPQCDGMRDVAQVDSFQILLQGVDAVKDYAIFALDTKGRIITWNRGAQAIKGYEAHEIIGQHFSKLYTQEDVDIRHPDFELQQARIFGRFEDQGWRVKKDGSQFWANVSTNHNHIVTFCHFITR
eukprot:GEZU01021883.1.p2 GENE.GEZU01021883.1~~GEZU01021883.1.p2  ORF type:complete len:144 (-),score=18.60 GEZU01021883.1:49-480(-)